MSKWNVLVLGSGGREHALACSLLKSPSVSYVFVCPGNAGMKTSPNLSIFGDINVRNHQAVVEFCHHHDIKLVVVGPEDLLSEGISDSFNNSGISCFGPSSQAARIECSKQFSKEFMSRFNLPTARWQAFTDVQKACDFIRSAEFRALVVKASGLAAGKGVVVAQNKDEACQAAADILQGRFGEAGTTIVIEELLEGEEISCLAFCDGRTVAMMPPAQDHKRLLDNDMGPNTGGMGAYCPCLLLKDLEYVKSNILQKSVDCLREIGCPFVGVLYAGLMLTSDGPKLLEFNCRFGDPETQVILPLLQSDLFKILLHCVEGKLSPDDVVFDTSQSAVGVVLASSSYPGQFEKGFTITGISEALSCSTNTSVYCAGVTAGDNGSIVTSGGRVLTVVVTDSSLRSAADNAQHVAGLINFNGRHYRTDIAHKAFRDVVVNDKQVGLTYESSGVSISTGDDLVTRIKPLARSTARLGCTPDLGLFGGIFDLKQLNYVDPLLVTGTDGVGTKLQIAQSVGIYNTIGIDLVAMSVNDVLCHAAESLFFLDCFSCSKLDANIATSVISGISDGCKLANCALIGGETAEMPGTYSPGEFEVSGFVVGAVERHQYLPCVDDVVVGDVVIGVSSSGVHSNGFSLVRAVVKHCQLAYEQPSPFELNKSLGESLLTPTKIYVRSTLNVLRSRLVKAAAHITGGGLPGNVTRVLPPQLGLELDASKWTMPAVFGWIYTMGNVAISEMSRTFNCGVGFVLIVSQANVACVLNQLAANGETDCTVIGCVIDCTAGASERVKISGLEAALRNSFQLVTSNIPSSIHSPASQKRVAVLISGSGTNLQALLDYTLSNSLKSAARIVLVVSNVAGAYGLTRAQKADVKTHVINHKDYKTRQEFDEAVHEKLLEEKIDIICLAGFMRILSGGFVEKWQGRILNVHPALLPSFKGAHAHRLVLEAGVRITGCTVHFVTEAVDAGAIVVQEAVPVMFNDTEETLSERVKQAEHRIYPQALELVASGKVQLADSGKLQWN